MRNHISFVDSRSLLADSFRLRRWMIPASASETGPQLTRHDLPKIMAKIYYALRHQIEDALAAGTMPENEIREWIFPSAI